MKDHESTNLDWIRVKWTMIDNRFWMKETVSKLVTRLRSTSKRDSGWDFLLKSLCGHTGRILFFLIRLSRRCLMSHKSCVQSRFLFLISNFLIFSHHVVHFTFFSNFNMLWNCFLFLISMRRLFDSSKFDSSELGKNSRVKTYWN